MVRWGAFITTFPSWPGLGDPWLVDLCDQSGSRHFKCKPTGTPAASSGSPAATRIRVPVAGRDGDARTRARILRHRRHTRRPIRDSAERLRGHVRRPHQVPAPSMPRLLRGRTSGLLARINTTERRVRRARRRPEPPPATCSVGGARRPDEHARARRVIEQEIGT